MATDTSGTRSVYNTLTGTTVDDVTLSGHWAAVEVINLAAFGGASLWVTVGKAGDKLVDPVASANETFVIPAGTSLTIEAYNGASVNAQVKVLGNGNAYGIIGLTSVHMSRGVVSPV